MASLMCRSNRRRPLISCCSHYLSAPREEKDLREKKKKHSKEKELVLKVPASFYLKASEENTVLFCVRRSNIGI